MEGTESLRWVLVDLVDVVVHIFRDEAREFYALERLWGDADATRFEDQWTSATGESAELDFAPVTRPDA